MASAKQIVSELVHQGVIPAEFAEEATRELHSELSRRAKRLAQFLASSAFLCQMSNHVSSMKLNAVQAS